MSGPDAGKPLEGLTILIVEDRYLIADELAEELRRGGAAVAGPVPNVAAAEALLAEREVDLAFLDVNLEGDTVFPLARRLADDGVPFVFVTGYDEKVLPAEWRDRPHVRKPFNRRALQDAAMRLKLSRRMGGSPA